MVGINDWWKDLPGERYWLGVTGSDGKSDVLATPRGAHPRVPSWTHSLISHVRDGDALFHYDETTEAIVAWSTPRGRVRERRLFWASPLPEADGTEAPPRPLRSLVIGLEDAVELESAVPLARIARTQWDLFPKLRAFEDRVGEPLYYPFAMDTMTASRLLPGYVFKLPALFVDCFPALAAIAARMPWSAAASTRTAGERDAAVAATATARKAKRPAGVPGLVLR